MESIISLALILLLRGAAAGTPIDVVSFIDPSDYFAARQIDRDVKNLLALASAKPAGPRESVQQLLAIRLLGQESSRLGDHKKDVHTTLDRLAEGEDEASRDEARIALARIDGKAISILHTLPKDSLRDGLAWFPEDTSLAAVLDLRAPAGKADGELAEQFRRVGLMIVKMMPGLESEGIYQFAESVGNCRIDRIAFAFAPLPGSPRNGRMFFRLSGRMDGKRLAAYLREKMADATFIDKKGPRGEPITTVVPKGSMLAYACVGDTDLIVAGYPTFVAADCSPIIDELLRIRAGGRTGLLDGRLGKLLRDARPEGRGLVAGSLPRGVADELARSPFGAAPEHFVADLVAPTGGGLDLLLRGTFNSEVDAAKFAEVSREQVKGLLEAVNDLPLAYRVGGASVRKMLESVEIKTARAEATVRIPVSAETCKALLAMAEAALSAQANERKVLK